MTDQMAIAQLLVDATPKVSVVVVAALAGAAVLRRRSAALRHWVLAAGLFCAATLPALRFVAPAWRVGAAVETGAVLVPFDDGPAAVRHAALAPARVDSRATLETLAIVWLVGAAVSVCFVAIGFMRVRRLAGRSMRVDDGPWRLAVADVSRHYGIRRPVTLLRSVDRTPLFTWGLTRPQIVLPAESDRWSSDRIRIVIGHELAHVKRGDWAIHIAAALLRSFYWFNPLVWIACARLRRESEHACDDAVLNLGVERTAYATELVDLARTFATYRRSGSHLLPVPAMAHRSSLEGRVRAMLDVHGNRAPVTRVAAVVTLTALLALALPLAGLGAQTGPASFTGSLLDTIGRILPDVAITLTSVDTGTKYDTRSDVNGHFAFAVLPSGEYDLHAERPGFEMRYRLTLKPGQQLDQPITLQVGTLHETLHVAKSDAAEPPKATDFPPLAPRQPGPCDQGPAGGCIEPPRKLDNTKPQYPPDRNDTVTIELRGRIGTDGRMKWAEPRNASAGDKSFVDAATAAVMQWRFSPTYLDGVPVEVDIIVTAHFSAD